MDHQKMGSKLSKSICKDGKKSQLCYKYLLGLKTGSSTTQEFRENITNLYKNNLSKSNIYDEIVDYLGINNFIITTTIILKLTTQILIDTTT